MLFRRRRIVFLNLNGGWEETGLGLGRGCWRLRERGEEGEAVETADPRAPAAPTATRPPAPLLRVVRSGLGGSVTRSPCKDDERCRASTSSSSVSFTDRVTELRPSRLQFLGKKKKKKKKG